MFLTSIYLPLKYFIPAQDLDLPADPILYKSKTLPFYDTNFEMQTKMIDSDCFISHIRGGGLNTGVVLNDSNAHPFFYPDAPIALAHNGGLMNGNAQQQLHINTAIMEQTDSKWFAQVRGTTDSECIYALLLSNIDKFKGLSIEECIKEAVYNTLECIKKIRKKAGVIEASPVNLFISNGEFILAVRYTFDFGLYTDELSSKNLTFYSLWYTYGEAFEKIDGIYQMKIGKKESFCFASEPLSRDVSTWLEVPEYSMMMVQKGSPLKLIFSDIDL